MSIKILYTNIEQKDSEPVGKVFLFDKYQTPSAFFPYLHLGEKSQILKYENWPDLVPYLYDKKIGFFTTIAGVYQYKNNFQIYSILSANSLLTLKFIDINSVNVLKALDEDKKMHYMENETNNDWNKTFTPLGDITINGITFLIKGINYYIKDITITNDLLATMTVSISVSNQLVETLIYGKNIEFGLHRIPGQTYSESVFFYSIKGKTFAASDSTNFIPGLRTRSQIIGHTHNHTHNMNNHTHSLSHSHDLSGHVHYMNHQHGYNDVRNGNPYHLAPWDPWVNPTPMGVNNYDIGRGTDHTRDYTDGPNNNSTQDANTPNTSAPSNNLTTDILSKNISKDDIYSNSNNFKVGNKTFGETYTICAYIYGKRYIPNS